MTAQQDHERYRARVRKALKLLDFVGAKCWEETEKFLKETAFTNSCPNCSGKAHALLMKWAEVGTRTTEVQARRAKALWESGMSGEAIAREVGVSGTWVRRRAKRGDWCIREDRPRRHWTKNEDSQLITLWKQGFSCEDIARQMPRTYDAVRYRLLRLRGTTVREKKQTAETHV